MSRIIKFINARPNTKTDMRISSGIEAIKTKIKKEMVCTKCEARNCLNVISR
jgi:polyferredoxin